MTAWMAFCLGVAVTAAIVLLYVFGVCWWLVRDE
jgi:hypothetical protein